MRYLTIAILLTFCFSAYAQSGSSWQYAVSPTIEIGVRNKLSDSNFKVEFEVTDPSGNRKFNANADAVESDFATVHFPSSFCCGTGTIPSGTYKWTAKVHGKVVGSGTFTITDTKKGESYFAPNPGV